MKLSSYKSKNPCNLKMFRIIPQGHHEKTWMSKDGTEHLICEMETSHLLNVYNMLMRIISKESTPVITGTFGNIADDMSVDIDYDTPRERGVIARVALRYVGHELYKRDASVSELPSPDADRCINRALYLEKGFCDSADNIISFDLTGQS